MEHLFLNSRNYHHYTEPERSLPCSQEPVTGPYSEPHTSIQYPHDNILRSILISSSHLHLGIPSDLLPSGFLIKLCMHFCHVLVTRSDHLVILDIILIIFGEKHQLWSSSSCNFLHLLHPSEARIVYVNACTLFIRGLFNDALSSSDCTV
jgi:hypothetical protein